MFFEVATTLEQAFALIAEDSWKLQRANGGFTFDLCMDPSDCHAQIFRTQGNDLIRMINNAKLRQLSYRGEDT